MEKVLGLGEERQRIALELALRTHLRQRQSESGRQEAEAGIPADIPLGDVLEVFNKQVPYDLRSDLLVRYLEQHAGLLIGRAEGIYTFPHRSFQEYLAACRLAASGEDAHDYAQRLCDLLARTWTGGARSSCWASASFMRPTTARWTSSTPWCRASPASCWPSTTGTGTPQRWRARLPWTCACPSAPHGNLYHENVLERLRTWLQVLLEGGHLAPRQRLGAGDTLGRLGQYVRRGVGRLPLVIHGKTVELPDLDWVHIPAGRFLHGQR